MSEGDGNIMNGVVTVRQIITPNRPSPLEPHQLYRMRLKRPIGRTPIFHFEPKIPIIDLVELQGIPCLIAEHEFVPREAGARDST